MHTFILIVSNIFWGTILWFATYVAYLVLRKPSTTTEKLRKEYEDLTEAYWIGLSVYNDQTHNIQLPIPKPIYDRLFRPKRDKSELNYQRRQSSQYFNVPKVKKLASYSNYKAHMRHPYQKPQIKSYLR